MLLLVAGHLGFCVNYNLSGLSRGVRCLWEISEGSPAIAQTVFEHSLPRESTVRCMNVVPLASIASNLLPVAEATGRSNLPSGLFSNQALLFWNFTCPPLAKMT